MSTLLSNDLEERKKHLYHLQDTLCDPIVLTSRHLIPNLLHVERLRIRPVEDFQDEKDSSLETKAEAKSSSWLSPVAGYLRRWRNPFGVLFDCGWGGEQAKSDGLAVLMLTSGSTGYAKAVSLRHGQIISATEGKFKYDGTSSRTTFFNWIGMDHVANLTEIHLHAMQLGSTQVHAHTTDILVNPFQFMRLLSNTALAISLLQTSSWLLCQRC